MINLTIVVAQEKEEEEGETRRLTSLSGVPFSTSRSCDVPSMASMDFVQPAPDVDGPFSRALGGGGGGGVPPKPNWSFRRLRTLTMANSMRAAKTKTRQVDIHRSMALM